MQSTQYTLVKKRKGEKKKKQTKASSKESEIM